MRLVDADYLKEKGYYDDHDVFIVDYDDIENAPTVDPFTHGHWVREEDEFGNYWSCSHCNQFNYSGKSRYCPHCGSKMDEIVTEEVKTNGA